MELTKKQIDIVHDVLAKMTINERSDTATYVRGLITDKFSNDSSDDEITKIISMIEGLLIDTSNTTGLSRLTNNGREAANSEGGFSGYVSRQSQQIINPMTETEMVNRILAQMNPGQHYRFLDIWYRVTGTPIGASGMVWKEAKKTLHLMAGKNLIRHIRNADNDAIVELRDSGLKIKEAGGLKFDINKLKDKFWTLGKKFFLWLTLGGLATWLLIWDRWIEPMINNKTNQQEEIVKQDSLSHGQETGIQPIPDSSKTNPIKNHTADSSKRN